MSPVAVGAGPSSQLVTLWPVLAGEMSPVARTTRICVKYGIDRKAAELAETQHGLITIAQARALGLGRHAIAHRVARGRWIRVHAGVYRLPGTERSWEQRLHALVLASGPVAAASHRSAAALLQIPGFERRGLIEVVTPRPRRHRDANGLVHRWRVLPDHHLTVIEGIPTTRVARTICDLAGVLHPARTERALDNCLSMGIATPGTIEVTFFELASRGRKGVAVMRRLLDGADRWLRGAGERARGPVPDLVRAAGLPDPVRQFDVGDAETGSGGSTSPIPPCRLLIELDSRRHHSALLDREADAARDAALSPPAGGSYGSPGPTSSNVRTRSSPRCAGSSPRPTPTGDTRPALAG